MGEGNIRREKSVGDLEERLKFFLFKKNVGLVDWLDTVPNFF